ncbi:MAG: dockerin type I repeat-containing protein [Eubacteriaceae bacterium]|nr:dockerin type I repeat-containing protein [Eubacteriaceae bacterium]
MKNRLFCIILAVMLLMPSFVFAAEGAVKDTFWSLEDKMFGKMYYHIPQVEYPEGAVKAGINEKIMDTYSEYYYEAREAIYDGDNMTYPDISNVSYACGDNGKILSVAVKNQYAESSSYGLTSYHMDIKTGKELSHEDIVLEYGYTWEEFISLSKDVLTKYFEDKFRDMKGTADYEFAKKLTADPKNYKKSVPFINSDGSLCILGWVGSIAGAGKYLEIVCIETEKGEAVILYPSAKLKDYTFALPEGTIPEGGEVNISGVTGDVDGNGKVNAIDATQILRYANGKASVFTNTTEEEFIALVCVSDINGDGNVNAIDATQILRYANGKPSLLK